MDSDSTGALLKKLCTRISGKSKENIHHYQLAVTLLNDFPTTESFLDGSSICDKVKRWLVSEKRLQDAAKFSYLFSELQKSAILKNKAEVLQFLLLLRDQGNISRKYTNCASLSQNPNIPSGGHGLFQPPVLHACETRNSRERCSSRSSTESGEGGRVAKLAAMYSATSHTDVSRETLIREILFALQSIEGNLIKMDIANDCFRLDPKVRVTVGERSMVMKLVELGWLYGKVKRFCDTIGKNISGGTVTDDGGPVNSAGLVNQSVVLAIKEELNEYCRLIAVLEAQMNEVGPSDDGHAPDFSSGGLTLRRLLMWTLEPRERLKTLAMLTYSVQQLKGGASLSALYQHLQHGCEDYTVVVGRVLHQACRPFFVMLTEWLLDGTLLDPHQEFFVSADPSVPNERLWHEKYDIRWNMLPSFLNKSEAQKILSAGKSLNFLRLVCGTKSPPDGREAVKNALQKVSVESLFERNRSQALTDLVHVTFRTTSSLVLDEILNKSKFVAHLSAIRRYMLLGQGDFIHSLMGLIGPELNKPAERLHAHNLSYQLESAIASSNAQFEDPEILKRLDIKLLVPSSGETGWTIFSLDYHVDGPIGTVLTSDCMYQYLMLFNYLWKAKRMESILSATWKHRSATSKLCISMPELSHTLHRIQLLLSEMNHLLRQISYYVTFEVLECSWHSLVNQLESAQSLDDVIIAHEQFLKRIVAGSLLDDASAEVRTQLRTIYDLMIGLDVLLERLYNAVVREIAARDAYAITVQDRIKSGKFGTSADVEQKEKLRRAEFQENFVSPFKTDLKMLSESYQDLVQTFLLMLSDHGDENLQLLSSRLDFNEHYLRRDCRLNRRLTYLHKRKTLTSSFFNDKLNQ